MCFLFNVKKNARLNYHEFYFEGHLVAQNEEKKNSLQRIWVSKRTAKPFGKAIWLR